MTALAVVVCTYHREALLARLLASVQAQTPAPGLDCEIVVVDNSDEECARATVRAAAGPFPARFVAAHPANIAVARNAGIAAAGAADWIAFVDDDQRVEPGWLDALAEAVAATPYDGLFGAVEPDFEAAARPSPRARALYTRSLALPAGAELFALGPRKTPGVALATNNCALRRAALPPGAPFDPAFGAGGGEDYDLFCRMQARGARFGWAPAMRAREDVPARRCEPAYLRRRFFAGGQAFAAAAAGASAHPVRTRWTLRAKAVAQLAILLALTPLRAAQGEEARRDHSFALAGALGKMAFGGIDPIYRTFDQKKIGGP